MGHGSTGETSRTRLGLSTIPVVVLLLAVVAYGFGEMVHAQLLGLGETNWPGYHELRRDPEPPTCDPEKFKVKAPGAAEEAAPVDDEDADLDALLEDDDEDADLDALLEDDDEDADLDALLEDDEEATAAGAAEAAQKREAAMAASMAAARAKCEEKHAKYADILTRITPGLERFRAVEGFVAEGVGHAVNHLAHALALLLLMCAACATALRAHISLRPIRSALDDRVSQTAQLIGNGLLLASAYAFKGIDEASGAANAHGDLHIIWLIGFAAMCGLNVLNLVRGMPDAKPGGKLTHALLAVPLYTTMALIAGTYFLVAEGHAAGLAIYLGKLTEHAVLYIHVGLYVWAGMLLKRTRMATLTFDVLRPWRLPPEMLAFVVVVGAALPTAYSGASGIFVIAAGAVIYDELRKAGARRQLAQAATAMSGSMGVVLRPCLLVVIVASLNKQVTTDQLFEQGFWVFSLTATLFFIACLIVREGPLTMAKPAEALPGTGRAIKALVPYGILFALVLVGCAVLLDAFPDEHSAPMILPMLLLARPLSGRPGRPKRPAPSASGGPSSCLRPRPPATSARCSR